MYRLDMKFKAFRIRFIFNFKIVCVKNLYKIASVMGALSGFLTGAGFSGEYTFHRFLDALAKMRTSLGNAAPESPSS
jgi:hypothetical protein